MSCVVTKFPVSLDVLYSWGRFGKVKLFDDFIVNKLKQGNMMINGCYNSFLSTYTCNKGFL